MASLHVFAQGILVLRLHDPVESENTLVGRYEIMNAGRFAQKIGYLTNGRTVMVLVGGRKGIIRKLPNDGILQIDLDITER